MTDDRFEYHHYLRSVAEADISYIEKKDVSYGASWKKRGGVGAFMMLARKWDRLEEMVKKHGGATDAVPWNIFSWIRAENKEWAKDGGRYVGQDGTVLAEIRDLRRYLLMVEAEMVWQDAIPNPYPSAAGAARTTLGVEPNDTEATPIQRPIHGHESEWHGLPVFDGSIHPSLRKS